MLQSFGIPCLVPCTYGKDGTLTYIYLAEVVAVRYLKEPRVLVYYLKQSVYVSCQGIY